jgi:hypothetical protein
MSNDLTEVSGIGAKTAETLRERGIETKAELLSAFEAGDRRVLGSPTRDGLNSRALDGIRDALFEQQGGFEDPEFGVAVDESNRRAFEAFAAQTLGDLPSIYDREDARGDPNVTADTSVLELGREAERGALFSFISAARSDSGDPITDPDDFYQPDFEERKRRAEGRQNVTNLDAEKEIKEEQRRSVARFRQAVDVAANVFGTDRAVLEEANRKRSRFTRRRGGDKLDSGLFPSLSSFERRVQPRAQAAAEAVNRSRSAEAQRVDSRRDAPVTTDLDAWADAPGQTDFPGVDTPEDRDEIFPHEPQTARAREAVRELVDEADSEVQRRVFADLPVFDEPEAVTR